MTEHALIDDNGDGQGTPADWFQGIRVVEVRGDCGGDAGGGEIPEGRGGPWCGGAAWAGGAGWDCGASVGTGAECRAAAFG